MTDKNPDMCLVIGDEGVAHMNIKTGSSQEFPITSNGRDRWTNYNKPMKVWTNDGFNGIGATRTGVSPSGLLCLKKKAMDGMNSSMSTDPGKVTPLKTVCSQIILSIPMSSKKPEHSNPLPVRIIIHRFLYSKSLDPPYLWVVMV